MLRIAVLSASTIASMCSGFAMRDGESTKNSPENLTKTSFS